MYTQRPTPNWFSGGLLVPVEPYWCLKPWEGNIIRHLLCCLTMLHWSIKWQLSPYSDRCCVAACMSSFLFLSALTLDRMMVGSGGFNPIAQTPRWIPPRDPRFLRANLHAVDLRHSRGISDAVSNAVAVLAPTGVAPLSRRWSWRIQSLSVGFLNVDD